MQRQLALQRLQEQEREMQMRFEQQKHLTQIRQMQAYGYPSNVRLMHLIFHTCENYESHLLTEKLFFRVLCLLMRYILDGYFLVANINFYYQISYDRLMGKCLPCRECQDKPSVQLILWMAHQFTKCI